MIWGAQMFKELFNSLAVEIENFIINEYSRPNFNDTNLEIEYYHHIVDGYNELIFNIDNILNNPNIITHTSLINEINEYKTRLVDGFEKYKNESIVIYYLKELENKNLKNYFFNTLYDFEKSLVSVPFVLVTDYDLQSVLTHAKEYSKDAQTYYFFSTNPYIIDPMFHIPIPNKIVTGSEEQFISKLFTYLTDIYSVYKTQNITNILEFKQQENLLTETLFEFEALITEIDRTKLIIETDTTGKDIFEYIEKISNDVSVFENRILTQDIYRVKALTEKFNKLTDRFETFKSNYLTIPLLQKYMEDLRYEEYLNKFQDYIRLIEDGKINLNKDYILTELNLKELTDIIIMMAKENKKPIIYNIKYTESGKPETLTFQFYQIDKFLTHIKTYYFKLVTNEFVRTPTIAIDNFGDSSIDDLREEHKRDLSVYSKYILQDVEFMNMYEYDIYFNTVVTIQNKLKKSTIKFIENAIKSSPMTFGPIISDYYKKLTTTLANDLIKVKKNKTDIVTSLISLDPKKDEAIKKLNQIADINENIKKSIELSKRYAVLNIGGFIESTIYHSYNDFYNELKLLFSKNAFNELLISYDTLYKNNILNFNMLFSLEKITTNVDNLFTKIDSLNTHYIDMQLHNTYSVCTNNSIEYVSDLFGGDTYKGVRYELTTGLDDFYNYMLEYRKSEYTFLINEKNIKKVYIDNQLIKMNYIRLYDLIMKINNDYMYVFESEQLTQSEKTSLTSDDIVKKLNTLILQQNKVISELTRTIIENKPNNTFVNAILSTDYIQVISTSNNIIEASINEYLDKMIKLTNLISYRNTVDVFDDKVNTHLVSWKDIICNNYIKPSNKVSYNDLEIISANIPLTVSLDAKIELDSTNTVPEFVWDFGEEIIKVGKKIEHTFYTVGLKTVKCEMKYPSGVTYTRILQFDLKPATNSQLVKSGKTKYSPFTTLVDQPKITFKDPITSAQITVPITIKGNITDMIGDGKIIIGENNDGVLLKEKIGYVILGFNGLIFAGTEFDYTTIFSDDFELPLESEFLFDFNISDPIVNKSIIDISNSKFIEYIAKVPKEKAKSVYEITDASLFQRIDETKVEIMPTDIIVMKNKLGRYMVLDVKNIKEITVPDEMKYYFEFDFEYYVNISLNTSERTIFSPLTTEIDIPTILFNTNAKELFGTIIKRLEEINTLKESIKNKKDIEASIVARKKIDDLSELNKTFYINDELERLKAKVSLLQRDYNEYTDKYVLDNNDQTIDIVKKINYLQSQLNNSKTFSEYMNSINAYDFKSNVVDLHILLQFYNDEINSMQLFIQTFDYRSHNIEFYINLYNNLRFIPKRITIQDLKGPYVSQIIQIVKLAREQLFKIKIILNFPIMHPGKYINFDASFKRLSFDYTSETFKEVNESDFYLLNKKLELLYGLEINKVESGVSYTSLIEEVVTYSKLLFGVGMDPKYVSSLGTYIQEVESNVIDEYDDYFMIPFWIDYLEKLS